MSNFISFSGCLKQVSVLDLFVSRVQISCLGAVKLGVQYERHINYAGHAFSNFYKEKNTLIFTVKISTKAVFFQSVAFFKDFN